MNTNQCWFEAVADCHRRAEAHVLVTVIGVAGSVPREPASKMVVTGTRTYDTVGGGHLEYRILARAREMLAAKDYRSVLEHFPLGAGLGQCCGGSVSVLLEARPGCESHLVLFGAGHVGQALVRIMGECPWRVTWVDSRPEAFPAELPGNIHCHLTDDPAGDAASLCQGSHALVLTHSHPLDYEICRRLLESGGHRSLGLIGSETKAQRFRQRLAHRGFSDAAIRSIRCPVGRRDVPGKRPMEVAVSISAELLSLGAADQPPRERRRGVSWRELRSLVAEEPASEKE